MTVRPGPKNSRRREWPVGVSQYMYRHAATALPQRTSVPGVPFDNLYVSPVPCLLVCPFT